jgi:Spy/CpxP family protein refolding chaperone
MDEEEEESQVPAETLPLTTAQHAQFAAEDDLESAEDSEPRPDEDMASADEESQLPAETLPLTATQRARFADDSEEESQATPKDTLISPDDSAREGTVSDIIGDALSPIGSDEGEKSQFPAETQALTRSQRRALYDDEESQFS